MKVFLDTNVLVSAVATRGLCADVLQAILAEHELVLGEVVLSELQRVLNTKLKVPAEVAREMDVFLRREAFVVSDAPALKVSLSDPDDVLVLAEAVAGAADFLVTGDRDLLELGRKAPLRIVNPRGFWDHLRSLHAGE